MLRSHVLTAAVAAGVLTYICAAQAQQATVPTSAENFGPSMSADQREQLRDLAKQMQIQAERGAYDPRAQALAAQASRRADDIADKTMAENRAQALTLLGLKPDSPEALYIFVSWSMPLSMLRSYVIEAMWTGATLVVRGVPPGRTLKDFLTKDMRELVWDKGSSAAVAIDPRLFDAYGVTAIPTIVLTKNRQNIVCANAGTRQFKSGIKFLTYDLCPPLGEDQYIKISGSLTLDYALEQFEANGFPETKPFLTALRRGYRTGEAVGKTQVPFTGDWNDAFAPLMPRTQDPTNPAQKSR